MQLLDMICKLGDWLEVILAGCALVLAFTAGVLMLG
jgi:hypothetical protein